MMNETLLTSELPQNIWKKWRAQEYWVQNYLKTCEAILSSNYLLYMLPHKREKANSIRVMERRTKSPIEILVKRLWESINDKCICNLKCVPWNLLIECNDRISNWLQFVPLPRNLSSSITLGSRLADRLSTCHLFPPLLGFDDRLWSVLRYWLFLLLDAPCGVIISEV